MADPKVPTVPLFDPDGNLGDVPYENMHAAVAAGAKPAVRLKSPDGTLGYVPADRMHDAVKAGGTIVPLEEQDTQHAGFWHNLGTDMAGFLKPSGFSPYPGMDIEAKQAALTQAQEADKARQQPGPGLAEGRGLPYRVGAAVAQSVGTNVPGMEESAAEGDVAGVLGHAAAPLAVMGATELAHVAPDIVKAVKPAIGDAALAVAKRTPVLRTLVQEPEQLVTQAVKPGKNNVGWQEAVKNAIPQMKAAEADMGRPIENLDDAVEAVGVAKKKIWSQYQNRLDPAAKMGATVDGNQIADAMVNSIDKRTAVQNPNLVQKIQSVADTYRRPLTVSEAEDFLQSANNDLHSYYAKNKVGRRVAQGDPETAYTVAEADALRNALYSKLEDLSGPGAREIKQQYGHLSNVEAELIGRKNVVARQDPTSLAEDLATIHAAGRFMAGDVIGAPLEVATAKGIKNLKSSDGMIARAFRKAMPAGADIAPPTQPIIRGALPRAPIFSPPVPDTSGSAPYNPPAYSRTTRAQRLGLLLPESASPSAPPPPRGFLPRGVYAQPGTFEPSQLALPPKQPIPLPSEMPPGPVSRFTFENGEQQGRPAPVPSTTAPPVAATPEVRPRAIPRAIPTPEPIAAADATQSASQPVEQAPAAPPVRRIIPRRTPVVMKAEQALGGNYGADSTVKTPSGDIQSKYKVVEASSLVPSHNAETFAQNPSYPPDVQERAYHTSKEAQARVIQQAQNYDPRYTVNTNPDAVNGPPIITPDGVVLGGNSRTMSTQRLYSSGNGEGYKSFLRQNADQFGLSPESIDQFKNPVLVREVPTPGNLESARRLGSELNKSMTGALGTSERAVTAGKSIKPESLHSISAMLDDLGPESSIRDLLRDRGKDVLGMMVKDGVITERERPQFADTATGGLSEEGKTFFEKALLGTVVDDPTLMDRTPKSILNKVGGSLGDIASVAPREDEYNILPMVREAVEEHADIANRGSNVETHLAQTGMFGPERNPVVDAIIRKLAENPKKVKEAFRSFAQDANFDQQGQGFLGLSEPPSPASAFNGAFGTHFTEDQFHDGLRQSLERSAQKVENYATQQKPEGSGNPPANEGLREQSGKAPREKPANRNTEDVAGAPARNAEDVPQSSSPVEPGYGSENRIVSPEEAKQAKKNLRDKFFRSNSGVDPTMLADATKLGLYHVEAGIREFGAWSKQMITDLGEKIRPHLESIFKQAMQSDESAHAPTFYSKALRTIEQKVPNAASGDSILATLRNAGVKADELHWTGLDDYLRGKPKVSKADVSQFMQENQIQLQEVHRGEMGANPNIEKLNQERDGIVRSLESRGFSLDKVDDPHGYDVLADDNPRWVAADDKSLPQDVRSRIERLKAVDSELESSFRNQQKGTKYAQYTLPGEKKNYSEVLLTLPEKKGFVKPALGVRGGESPGNPNYYTTHFPDDANPIAHVRFDERTDAAGKKVLLIEEVQSDWHQKGKKEGYQGKPPEPVTITSIERTPQSYVAKFSDGQFSMVGKGTIGPGATDQQVRDYYKNMVAEKNNHLQRQESQKVPDAPFKSDWHELVMKRMLRYAAEHGYDKVGWVTGEQTAARYDLSKKIDKVEATKTLQGKYAITATDNSGKTVLDDVFDTQRLPDVVGKDLAEKITKEVASTPAMGQRHNKTYSGLDLKTGGEWAKNLYDKAIPNFMNKYGKKWGARVGESEIVSGNKDGRVLDTILRDDFGTDWGSATQQQRDQAIAIQDGKAKPVGKKVHSVDVTPEMKKSVLKEGQPIAKVNVPRGPFPRRVDLSAVTA